MSRLLGLNHLTLTVSDLDKSLAFYRELLGFRAHVRWDQGAYLSLGELWICLTLGQPDSRQDYTHIALGIAPDHFAELSTTLMQAGVQQWKSNVSEGDSLYILDPDAHKLEIHVGSLQTRLDALRTNPYPGQVWLE